MGAIYRREVGAFFTSPIAYVFLAAFYLATGFVFYSSSIYYNTTDMSGVFLMTFPILLILIPILTMRLFADEKRLRTEQALLTAPVRISEMVFGKYFAAVTLYVCGLAIFFVYALVLQFYADDLSWSYIISNILALFLLGCAFISVGLFFSSLTESQVVAAVLSVFALIFIWLINAIATTLAKYELLADILLSLSVYSKYQEFTNGLFNLSSIIFMLSMIFIFNFLTIRIFDKRRWA
ncbi:MAG: ABC transporter permease subunit [Oscillospiraceae bacterium]|jgi:ABC-2 type transport system permease protein|nr:ABC transporter permease subunit [Oscillospiraceae bacterium]